MFKPVLVMTVLLATSLLLTGLKILGVVGVSWGWIISITLVPYLIWVFATIGLLWYISRSFNRDRGDKQ